MTIVLAAISACTQPAVAPKPFAFQERENTVRDWNTVGSTIADDIARAGLLAARTPRAPGRDPNLPPMRFHVHLLAPAAKFLTQVRDSLETEILARGGIVSRTPVDSLVVNLDVETVIWSQDRRPTGGVASLQGIESGLGIVLGDNGPYTAAGIFGIAAGSGIAADVIGHLFPDTNVEAVWKATILTGDTEMLRAEAPVYVRAGDLDLYRPHYHLGPIASGMPDAPRPVVRMRYDP